jgi:hypothetical protein
VTETRRIDRSNALALNDEPHPQPKPEHRDAPHYETNAALLFARNVNDRVLYVGMNAADSHDGKGTPENELEWKSLSYLTGGRAERVQTSSGSTVEGFDISSDDGMRSFVKSLGLDDERSKGVVDVLRKTPTAGRDEIANIAKVLARGEKGGVVPSRWILSGHYGDTITDGSGSGNALRTEDVRAIAKALPKGAAMVEDIMVSGCYSGGKEQLEAWKTAFPNLRSAWGYGWQGSHGEGDKSPTGANAVRHVQEWELETRGRAAPVHAREALHGIVGAGNVSYWDGAYHPAISGQHDRAKP